MSDLPHELKAGPENTPADKGQNPPRPARPWLGRLATYLASFAGGMAVNETLMQLACESVPFGGVGASGMGAYHGYEGFATFSKLKPVFTQARLNARSLIAPPYGRRVNALLKLMMRF